MDIKTKIICDSSEQVISVIKTKQYEHFLLALSFYKRLCDLQVMYVQKQDATEDDIKALNEEDTETLEFVQSNLGYFIGYNNLFSTWIEMGCDFDISNVRDALHALNRLSKQDNKSIFEKVFVSLQEGLSRLGESTQAQTQAISKMIYTIEQLPPDLKTISMANEMFS